MRNKHDPLVESCNKHKTAQQLDNLSSKNCIRSSYRNDTPMVDRQHCIENDQQTESTHGYHYYVEQRLVLIIVQYLGFQGIENVGTVYLPNV